MFKQEMCKGINEENAKKVLSKHGWIKTFTEGKKKLYVKRTNDVGRPRMMHFSLEAMQSFEDEI